MCCISAWWEALQSTELFCVLLLFSQVKFLWLNFKHVRSSLTAADIHQTTETKNSLSEKETKVKSTRTVFAFVHSWVWALFHPPDKSEVYYLQGWHAGTFSKWIKKQKQKSQTMLKNTSLHCIISTVWCHISKMTMTMQNVVNFVHEIEWMSKKYAFVLFQNEVLLYDLPLKEQSLSRDGIKISVDTQH